MKINMPMESILSTNPAHSPLTENKKDQWLRAWEKSSFSEFNDEKNVFSRGKNNISDSTFSIGAKDFHNQNTDLHIKQYGGQPLPGMVAGVIDAEHYIFTLSHGDPSAKVVQISTEIHPDEVESINNSLLSQQDPVENVQLTRNKPLMAMLQLQDINVQIVIRNGLATIWIRDFKKLLDKTNLQQLFSHLKDSIEAKGYKISDCMLNAEIYIPNPLNNEESYYGR